MTKLFIIAFLVSIALGSVLVNPWVQLCYFLFLAIATAVILFLVVFSLVKRTNEWKTALLFLTVGYTAALSSCCIQSYRSSKIKQQREDVISTLYNYQNRYGHFPKTDKEVTSNLSALRGNYIPDATLNYFTLYTKDLYGMPWVFTSRDSTWGR